MSEKKEKLKKEAKTDPVENENSKAKKGKKGFVLLIVLAVLLALLIVVMCVFNSYYSKLNIIHRNASANSSDSEEEIIKIEDEQNTQPPLPSPSPIIDDELNDVTNILLIGVDNDNLAGMDSRGNSDGMIILSINKTTNQIVLNSLMRDIYVNVGGQYNTKLTYTYHNGGVPLLIDTIENSFGIPIDNYVLVNYINVIDIVDAFGGVDLDVTQQELGDMQTRKIENLNGLMGEPYGSNSCYDLQPGRVTLNGIQAAAYMRIRYSGNGDYERTERARKVILALKDKAANMSISELNDVANTVLPYITTDFTGTQLVSLAANLPKYLKYDMLSNRIPIDNTSYHADKGGASVVVVDFEANREFLYNSIYKGMSK